MQNNEQSGKVRVLIVGCGNMGTSHATAYHDHSGFEICGLVARGSSKERLNEQLGGHYPLYSDYQEALEATRPDAVCISTYPETHARYAIQAFEQKCHVFVEKPLADNMEDARKVADAAKRANRKLVVGYILRYHPSWEKFVELSGQLGKPLVMRMNLNQQSRGHMWNVHRSLMGSLSPIVDCGVHYIDVMCQMTESKPLQVNAIGARLTDDIPEWNYNYGQLQIRFEDGSVGWYEAGWGPMISETAFFVKDVFGPKGALSIVAKGASATGNSDNISAHTQTESLRLHHADIDDQNNFIKKDEWIDLSEEPDHQELCNRQQRFFYRAITEDLDVTNMTSQALNSLEIALACDTSVKTGQPVELNNS